MSLWQFAIRTLRHFWRVNLALLLGITIAAAVLTGALVVGDSVRDSLKHLTIERLGRIDEILLGQHYFRAELADSLRDDPDVEKHYREIVPAILLNQATVELDAADRLAARRQGVTVVGSTPAFWQLGLSPGDPRKVPAEDQIVINRPLAEDLGAQVGDRLLLRIEKPRGIPADSPLANTDYLTETIANLELIDILPAEGLGRFSLAASQQVPVNAFVHQKTLQTALRQQGKVNALLVAGKRTDEAAPETAFAALRQSLTPQLDDLGLSLKRVTLFWVEEPNTNRQVVLEYDSLSNNRMLFSPSADKAVRQALHDIRAQSVFTYLATRIEKLDEAGQPVGEVVPYSTVTGVDSNDELGPLLSGAGEPVDIAEDSVVLNRWAADVLNAGAGDRVRITYFEPETEYGETRDAYRELVVQDIARIATPARPFSRRRPAIFHEPPTLANDPDLTPEVPGITDQASIDNWETPFPIDYDLIQRRDDLYWDDFRTTPKAFVSLAAARNFWRSRFGATTSYRLAVNPGESLEARSERLALRLRDDADAFGLQWLRVKAEGLSASRGTTPFGALFLGFSMFIIAAGLILVSLLLRLGLEQRASQLGLLASLGFAWKRSLRLLLLENLVLTVLGSLLGVLVGIAYAWFMIVGLRTWWLSAVVTPFLEISLQGSTLVLGGLLGIAAALLTIIITLWRLRRVDAARLLTGRSDEPGGRVVTEVRPWLRRAPWVLILLALFFAVIAPRLAPEAQAGAFFGAGSCVLVAILLLVSGRLRRWAAAASDGSDLDLKTLAVRNLTRNPTRSTLTIGLVAAACFLIVAISAFRQAPTDKGTGGFELVGISNQPIFSELQDVEVRKARLPGVEGQLTDVAIFPLRMQDGDDASCRNLYQSVRPQLIGVTPAFRRGAPSVGEMEWAGVDARRLEAVRKSSAEGNDLVLGRSEPDADGGPESKVPVPASTWDVLARSDLGGSAIPVVLDKNTAMYSLQLFGSVGEEFEVDYGPAGPLRFRVVGLLAGSIFQGSLLIPEEDLLEHFSEVSGYRYFLVDTPAGQEQSVAQALEDAFSDQGLDLTHTHRLLSELLAVQNTYLSTFQSLGGLGLLLGTFGLAAVQVRNVVQRQGEFALMRATGFRYDQLTVLVLLEHTLLLLGGLGVGVAAALVVVLPHLLLGGASVPFGSLLVTLGLIIVVGLASGFVAQRSMARLPLLPALRAD